MEANNNFSIDTKDNIFIRICFWANVLCLVTSLLLGAVLIFTDIIDHKDFMSFTKDSDIKLYFLPLSICILIHWIFCIRFWHKHDKYSKAIYALIFLNFIYAPFYYYQVRIKQRPLKNTIAKKEEEAEEEEEDYSVTDDEFHELNRQNIFSVLHLWTSKEVLLSCQNDEYDTQVLAALFRHWKDSYMPESEDFTELFSEEELELLEEFNEALEELEAHLPEYHPTLGQFVETVMWTDMNKTTLDIIERLKQD
ncbi:hypothetical protein EYV94_23270 [Puteibacter caeruleilacunae]|nr:hypothetical protein EYV94_23270 [Puteibacter caeruleilacunae]